MMPIKTETHHVKAHQDRHKNYDDLPRDAQVNCDMDAAAEDMRESTFPTPPVPIFQSNKIAITLGNIVVTDQINKRLRHHFMAPPLQEYLKRKFQWSDEIFRSIDWITMRIYAQCPKAETHQSNQVTTRLAAYQCKKENDSR